MRRGPGRGAAQVGAGENSRTAGRALKSQGRPPGDRRKGARPAAHPVTSVHGVAGYQG